MQGELASAKSGSKGLAFPELSVLGAFAKTRSIAGAVITHLLDRTTLDDQVVGAVHDTCGAAKNFTGGLVDKITAVDYNEHMKSLAKHEIYLSHVAPTMGKVADFAQPHVDKYVSPALEHAKVYTGPALESAKVHYAKASKTVEGEVLPALERTRSFAASEVPRLLSLAEARIGLFLAPLFDALALAAPQHGQVLPVSTLDRFLVLCVGVFLAYYSIRIGSFFLRYFLRIALRIMWITFKLVIAHPFSFVKMILGYAFWFGTGFYCCGICRPRRSAKAEATNGKPTNGKANGHSAAPKATLAEVSTLLEASKKKGKLDAAAKLLAGAAGTGKALDGKQYPEDVRGKQLEKEVLKKALAQFKEVDAKKLGL